MSKPLELEAALARAETALTYAVANSAHVGAGWIGESAVLDKARVSCSRLHAALVERKRSESNTSFDEVHGRCRDMRDAVLELNPSASLPLACFLNMPCELSSTPPAVCWLEVLEDAIPAHTQKDTAPKRPVRAPTSSAKQAVRQSDHGSSLRVAQPRVKATHADPSLRRHAIGLLALILAYLVYFHVDVQLQILSLPSLFP